jgi:hypothetical protein
VIGPSGGDIYLAGIDDAHFYRADNIEKAASGKTERFAIMRFGAFTACPRGNPLSYGNTPLEAMSIDKGDLISFRLLPPEHSQGRPFGLG